ncbi:hypothetical protein BsWGS_10989 [Bradybaena similaris]
MKGEEPCHAGVVCNERANKLAGNAVILEGQPMDRSDIMCALREQGYNEDLQVHPSPSIDGMYGLVQSVVMIILLLNFEHHIQFSLLVSVYCIFTTHCIWI